MSVKQGAAWVAVIAGIVVWGWLATPRPDVAVDFSCPCGSQAEHDRAAAEIP